MSVSKNGLIIDFAAREMDWGVSWQHTTTLATLREPRVCSSIEVIYRTIDSVLHCSGDDLSWVSIDTKVVEFRS